MKFVLIGSVVILAMMWALLTFKPIPGATTGLFANLVAALSYLCSFFVRDSFMPHLRVDRHVIDPVSGMTIATLMATCAFWGRLDRRGVCRSGDHYWRRGRNRRGQCWRTSQDLKTGYLVGAIRCGSRLG